MDKSLEELAVGYFNRHHRFTWADRNLDIWDLPIDNYIDWKDFYYWRKSVMLATQATASNE